MNRLTANRILKGVSRSFYLSLRLLPAPMRPAASLGYLLARTSDTLADSANAPSPLRIHALDQFALAVATHSPAPTWPNTLTASLTDPREATLLAHTPALLHQLDSLPHAQATLVRNVTATIISGQKLDLSRFANASPQAPTALPDDKSLDDYTYRVAGCVGEFWTHLGILTLGPAFSTLPLHTLLPLARSYGEALQLVNILRDLPADLAIGRCYLPVTHPSDTPALLACHARWLTTAQHKLSDALTYAASLKLRRLRAASLLPALLARETLQLLDGSCWETLQSRVKVSRRHVYALLLHALLSPSPKCR